jgi:hypothetical protein
MAFESDGDAIVRGVSDGIRTANRILAVATWLFYAFARPIVLVTQVILRKDLGERYYTQVQTLLCVGLLLLATFGPSIVDPYGSGGGRSYYNPYTGVTTYERAPQQNPTTAYICGDIWLVLFAVASSWHYWVSLRLRRKAGGQWHSRSNGLPRFPQQNLFYELALIGLLAGVAFVEHVWGIGILLSASFLLTAAAERHARQELYNRVLDAVDGQIESEWLGKAIEQRLSPAQTQGLSASLPAHVSDTYRKKVAELLKRPETD